MPWSVPLAFFATVALLMFVFLGQYAALVRTQYQIVSLKEKQRVLERERSEMLLEVQQLSSLERIEKLATGRLRMAPPPHRQVLDLNKVQRAAAQKEVRGQVAAN